MTFSITDSAVKAALSAIESESATAQEKIEMLIELAHGFQKKPKTTQDLQNAIELYNRASELSEEDYPLYKARAKAGIAGVMRNLPNTGVELLLQAKVNYEEALLIFKNLASPEEIAEAEMNLGLVLQSLMSVGLASIKDVIKIYQSALQVFTQEKYPAEYAILQNNIAIAYLSSPGIGEPKFLSEGLAVQTFEEALKYINLIEHPREYAMLQNNLGNALQYLQSSHPLDNLVRAVKAYDEALKVRNPKDTPLEYAKTVSNKANALRNLPDDLLKPEKGNSRNLLQASKYYKSALEIFNQYQQTKQVELLADILQEIRQEIKECKMKS